MLGGRQRSKSMKGNKCLLDANAVLRFLLRDNEEQFMHIRKMIRTKECYVTLEVMAEVCYVLEGLYQVSRQDIISSFRKLNNDIVILYADVLLRALEIFNKTPKLDFVDCLLYGYKKEKRMDIITFDKKLQKRLDDI